MAKPTRRDATQLDDLASPLLDHVGDETLRYVSAALSQSRYAPPSLVRKLADLPVDISAPLLVQSPVFTAIDLVALIGRHGLPHARAIARRPDLDHRILGLVRALGALEAAGTESAESAPAPAGAEQTRTRLRAMMRPSEAEARPDDDAVRLRWEGDPGTYRKLRATALTGARALFQTALADGLDIDMERARALIDDTDISSLLLALRALDLAEEQALLIVRCVRPDCVASLRTISDILEAYGRIALQDAERVAEAWRRSSRRIPSAQPSAANDGAGAHTLKVS